MKTDVEIAQTSAVPKQQQAPEMWLLIFSFQNSTIQVMLFWVSHNL
jgi:hypothetical protein